jgi:hypothetical protein
MLTKLKRFIEVYKTYDNQSYIDFLSDLQNHWLDENAKFSTGDITVSIYDYFTTINIEQQISKYQTNTIVDKMISSCILSFYYPCRKYHAVKTILALEDIFGIAYTQLTQVDHLKVYAKNFLSNYRIYFYSKGDLEYIAYESNDNKITLKLPNGSTLNNVFKQYYSLFKQFTKL